jgi:hypothetical protein
VKRNRDCRRLDSKLNHLESVHFLETVGR